MCSSADGLFLQLQVLLNLTLLVCRGRFHVMIASKSDIDEFEDKMDGSAASLSKVNEASTGAAVAGVATSIGMSHRVFSQRK